MYMHDMGRKLHDETLPFTVPLPFNGRSRVRDFNFWRRGVRPSRKKAAEIDTSCNAFKQLRDVKYRARINITRTVSNFL